MKNKTPNVLNLDSAFRTRERERQRGRERGVILHEQVCVRGWVSVHEREREFVRETENKWACMSVCKREREREREPRLNKQAFDNISRSVLLQVFMSEGYECVVH